MEETSAMKELMVLIRTNAPCKEVKTVLAKLSAKEATLLKEMYGTELQGNRMLAQIGKGFYP